MVADLFLESGRAVIIGDQLLMLDFLAELDDSQQLPGFPHFGRRRRCGTAEIEHDLRLPGALPAPVRPPALFFSAGQCHSRRRAEAPPHHGDQDVVIVADLPEDLGLRTFGPGTHVRLPPKELELYLCAAVLERVIQIANDSVENLALTGNVAR